MKRNEVEIKSIEYDVKLSTLKTQPDLEKLVEFVTDGKHTSMCIEYSSNDESKRRRRVLQAWLTESEYRYSFCTKVRGSKLYVLKEGDKV